MENNKITTIVFQLIKTNLKLSAAYKSLLDDLRQEAFTLSQQGGKFLYVCDNYFTTLLKGVKGLCKELKVEERHVNDYLDNILTERNLQDNDYYLPGFEHNDTNTKLKRLAKIVLYDTWVYAETGYSVDIKGRENKLLIPTEAEERMMVTGYLFINQIMSIVNQKSIDMKQAYCVEALISLFMINLILKTPIEKEW